MFSLRRTFEPGFSPSAMIPPRQSLRRRRRTAKPQGSRGFRRRPVNLVRPRRPEFGPFPALYEVAVFPRGDPRPRLLSQGEALLGIQREPDRLARRDRHARAHPETLAAVAEARLAFQAVAEKQDGLDLALDHVASAAVVRGREDHVLGPHGDGHAMGQVSH